MVSALLHPDGKQGIPPQPSQIIVKFIPDAGVALSSGKDGLRTGIPAVNALHTKYGAVDQRRLATKQAVRSSDSPLRSAYIFRFSEDTDLEAAVADYTALPQVEYAVPDEVLQLHDVPDDPLYTHQWSLNNTGQEHYHVMRINGDFNDTLALVQGIPGADIEAEEVLVSPPDNTATTVVAIIDSGVDWEHPDLAGRIWSNEHEVPNNGIDDDNNGYVDDIRGWDFNWSSTVYPPYVGDNDPTDYMGHGTHCAGIVAAVNGNGIGVAGAAPDVKIMALRTYPLLASYTGEALVYAADNGADVVNMSFGGTGESEFLREVCEYARARGVILVSSAGNHGNYVVSYPASYPNVISVAASNDSDYVTTWSTYNEYVDVCAPGQSVLSLRASNTDIYGTFNEPGVHIVDEHYYLASGTSMSGPYVVAVTAYLRAVSPGLTQDRTLEILQTTSHDIVDPFGYGWEMPGWDWHSGWGRVSLLDALAAAPAIRAQISSPREFDNVSATVEVWGSADGSDFTDYILEYAPLGGDAWIEFHNSSSPVAEGLLGTLDCSGIPAGEYLIQLRVGDHNCDQVKFFVTDGTVLEISQPAPNDTLQGRVDIEGAAYCPDFRYALVDYGAGQSPTDWMPIDTISIPVAQGFLTSWDVSDITAGHYTLRIRVLDETGVTAVEEMEIAVVSPFTPPDGWDVELPKKPSRVANYVDIDRDGLVEFVIGTETGVVFVNLDGTIKTSGVPLFPVEDCRTASVAVGRLDHDHYDDIAVMGEQYIYLYRSAEPAVSIRLDVLPEQPITAAGFSSTSVKLFLRDMDGDGVDEVHYSTGVTYTDPPGYRIYRADGSAWGWCDTKSAGPPIEYWQCLPADLDGDGSCEVYCYGPDLQSFDIEGCPQEAVEITHEGVPLNPDYVHLSTADVDTDSLPELILTGARYDGYSIGGQWVVYAFDDGLNPVPGWPHNTGVEADRINSMMTGPAFADLDGDGEPEYVCANYDAVRAWRLDGSPFTGDTASHGLLAAPAEPGLIDYALIGETSGDSQVDALAMVIGNNAHTYPVARVESYSVDGELETGFPLTATTESLYRTGLVPTLGDFDKDGYLEMVTPCIVGQYPGEGRLLYQQFDEVPYRDDLSHVHVWNYSRRFNCDAGFIDDPEPSIEYPVAVDVNFGDDAIGHLLFDSLPTIYWSYLDTSASTQAEYEIEIGLDDDWSVAEMWATGPLSGSDTSIAYAGEPFQHRVTYYARQRVHNGGAWGEWRQWTFTAHLSPIFKVPNEFPSIQHAVDIASVGDTVLVAPGDYYERIVLGTNSPSLVSEEGADDTKLWSEGTATTVISIPVEISFVGTIAGFTIENTRGILGILGQGSSNIEISDCVFQSTPSAVHLYDSRAVIRNCSFYLGGGSSNQGHALRFSRGVHVTIDSCTFGENGSTAIYAWSVDSLSLTNSTGYANSGGPYGGGFLYLVYGSDVRIVGNTIVGNTAQSQGAGLSLENCQSVLIRNNIVANNSGGWGILVSNSNDVVADYNDVYGNEPDNYLGVEPGVGSMSLDPLFVDTVVYDFNLQETSPCIDAGHPDPAYDDPDGTRADMGALASTCTDTSDVDSDGITFCYDNCPAVSNPEQVDGDSDGVGDACDNCVDTFNPAQTDVNGNGIGDACETCCVLVGDINHDGAGPNITDLVHLATYMFSDGPSPVCEDPDLSYPEADIDGSGTGPDIADLVYLETYMFQSGPAPVPCQ
jgi:parallel beta-helix repeat protein